MEGCENFMAKKEQYLQAISSVSCDTSIKEIQTMRNCYGIRTLRAGRTVARSEGVRAVDA